MIGPSSSPTRMPTKSDLRSKERSSVRGGRQTSAENGIASLRKTSLATATARLVSPPEAAAIGKGRMSQINCHSFSEHEDPYIILYQLNLVAMHVQIDHSSCHIPLPPTKSWTCQHLQQHHKTHDVGGAQDAMNCGCFQFEEV